jgi:hypothetical protein
VNGVLSEVRVVVFDAEAKPSCERARRRRCTSASERRFGSSLAHTAERLTGLEIASHSERTEVPIWRAWWRSSGDVLCARSVRDVECRSADMGASRQRCSSTARSPRGVLVVRPFLTNDEFDAEGDRHRGRRREPRGRNRGARLLKGRRRQPLLYSRATLMRSSRTSSLHPAMPR